MKHKDLVGSLSNLLANYYALFTKTQGYHWNILGPHFLDLHSLFQKQYELMFVNIDEIAERIRALEAFAPVGIKSLSNNAIMPDGKQSKAWREVITELCGEHKFLCKLMYETSTLAEKKGDIVTVDLMVRLLNEHEKQVWILNSLLHD